MQISTVSIQNFGCLENVEATFDDFTVFVGANNAGKSTILKGIELFFASAPKVSRQDFFRHEADRVISVSIRFHHLTPDDLTEFGNAVIDGAMTVSRKFGGDYGTSGLYEVEALAYGKFAAIREEANGTTRRGMYTKIRDEYGLPAVTGDAIFEALNDWEIQNPDKLERVKQRDFFGAVNVANGKIKKKTSLRFVRAVTDVSKETSDPKSSPIIELLGDLRRQALENQPKFNEIVDNANKNISTFIQDTELKSVARIGSDISELLQKYYSDTKILAHLPPPNEMQVSFPPPTLQVEHRELSSPIETVGHGLQRALLFAVVQYLAEQFDQDDGEDQFEQAASDIVLLIEEPEIFQHPQKQRIIRDVLRSISEGFSKSTGIRFQIAICTHSEKFVDILRVDDLRVMRTSFEDGKHLTQVQHMALSELRDSLFAARGSTGQPMHLDRFRDGMHIFSEAISEGFFAERVVLVEGAIDAAILQGALRANGVDAAANGIAILPVDGKTKLDKPLQSFISLGFKTYCVFDNDHAKNPGEQRTGYNKLLQNILSVAQPVDFPSGVHANFAAYEGNFEEYIKVTAGDIFEAVQQEVVAAFQIDDGEYSKSPASTSAFLRIAKSKGVKFEALDNIVSAILA